jgi:hypothetical protein
MSKYSSNDKMDVTVKRMPKWDDKLWVVVTLKRAKRFIPSFEDLYRIVRAICYCEDEKYPSGKGAEMVKEFLSDTCDGTDFDLLRAKYNIPERNGEDNG